ncbi:hypothetical protein S7711_03170 [Stachybotrys chartarum IBT 7711]|uniref:Shugoshin n=1 Tax=Stachybotrys chartarum (strain CBS 109288 / IBT 7711) TaxID=1280523 RepID=A0A084AWK5_STACB|nr:hypothetical protein S7711_03170 [Stachybotrys chartarum IBT 7711]
MARLNEIPMSSDSIETLRRKMLRQNRDLAKSNNIRALRIRELENECACMLSENLQLRGRILELEKEVEDNESRRIADHALAIKHKLESQLTEWGILLAGLGLEPPMKRHSPRIAKTSIKQRMSFTSSRPSPSQRRLRDIAKDIEDLGPISENKSYPRMSLNPEQILALRSEVHSSDSVDSPELGPPPMSHFIDEEPTKVDTPSKPTPSKDCQPSPKPSLEPPVTLLSPETRTRDASPVSPSPQKRQERPAPKEEKQDAEVPKQQPKTTTTATPGTGDVVVAQPVKMGAKRKLAAREESEKPRLSKTTDENQPPRTMSAKVSIREKAEGKTLKELASLRKEANGRPIAQGHSRKPLAAKSTNDDIASPKKNANPRKADDMPLKGETTKPKSGQDKPKAKPKVCPAVTIEPAPAPAVASPIAVKVDCEPEMVLAEPTLLSPTSPAQMATEDASRGDTPPPVSITSQGETSRPSRRNRTAVSYAEPNLRDKMRRPTKELFDAVAGEGKYSRRSSQCEVLAPDVVRIKRESDVEVSLKSVPSAGTPSSESHLDSPPASPSPLPKPLIEDISTLTLNDKKKRSSVVAKGAKDLIKAEKQDTQDSADVSEVTSGTGDGSEVDVYEFTTSSPQPEKEEPTATRRKNTGRQSRSSRRFSAAVESDENVREPGSSRRRSMML